MNYKDNCDIASRCLVNLASSISKKACDGIVFEGFVNLLR